MTPQSAKAKGRRLQQWVRDKLIEYSDGTLKKDDVRSTSMGTTGEDVQLSTKARELWPFKIECKNKREVSVSNWYKQAQEHEGDYEPLLIVKQDNEKPLVVLDAETFFKYYRQSKFNWKDIY